MSISRKAFNSRWSALHGGAEVSGAVKGWLAISYLIARGLNFFRITPNIMTVLGVLLSGAMLWPIVQGEKEISIAPAIILLVLSLIADGVDGSLAIYQDKESEMGGIYDTIADRISEAFWLTFVFYCGVPAGLAIIIWILGATIEYARARLASMGHVQVGVVTPAERPVRAIYVLFTIILSAFALNLLAAISIGFIALQLFSVLMIVKMARSILR
jgi:CDP-diacylglycerol--glycerol-3-phosphate 3-phosphatidyltransferase